MRAAAILVTGWLAALPAWGLDYRSVAEAAAMYDAPSQQGKPLYAIARGTPVEVVVSLDTWIKVRDANGDLAWVEKRLLSERRTVIVTATWAQVRAKPEDGAAAVFDAERNVILEFVEAGPTGWIKIRHRDGQQGYVKISQIWGS